MRIHPDKAMRYPCTVEGCSKSVRWPKDMQKHFRTHHSAILWPCKEGGCDVVWGRGDQLLRHLHAEHSKTDNPASDNSIGELTYRRAVDIARITEGDLDPMITAYLKTAYLCRILHLVIGEQNLSLHGRYHSGLATSVYYLLQTRIKRKGRIR